MFRLGYRGFAARFAVTCALASGLSFGEPSAEAGSSRLETIVSRFPTLASFLADSRALKEYTAALDAYYGRSIFPCEKPQAVLAELETLLTTSPQLSERIWKRSTASDFEIAWRETPETPERRFHFVASPRPFHSIWEDLSQKACPRSDCHHADLSSPARWASLLEGAQLYRIEDQKRFSGASLLVTRVEHELKPLILISASAHPFLKKKGWAAPVAKKAPRIATLLEHFADAAKLTSAVRAEVLTASAPQLKRFDDGKVFGTLKDVSFADPVARVIEKDSPSRCSAGGTGGLLSGFGSPVPAKVTASYPWNASTTNSPADSDKKALAEIVLNLSGKKDAPTDPLEVELMLQKSLQNDRSEAKRAQAALGLDLLGRSAVDPGARATYGSSGVSSPAPKVTYLYPQTPLVLAAALKDPSESVRGLAAMGLANTPGGMERPGVAANLGANIDPSKVFPGGSPALSALNPSDLLAKQAGPFAQKKEELPKPLLARMFDRMAKENDPARKEKLLDHVVKSYLDSSNGISGQDQLRFNLSRYPELAASVLAEIEKRGITGCKTPGAKGGRG